MGELEKALKRLSNEEQQLGINEQEGKKRYESVFQDLQPCKDVKADETVKELTPKHLQYSLAMADVCISEEVADLTLRILDRLGERGGDFSLKDACEIRAKWDKDCSLKNEKLTQNNQPNQYNYYDNRRNY